MVDKKVIRVVQYGLGPIGAASARAVMLKQKAGFAELVGAIDIDPGKAGRDVADVAGLDEPTGVIISGDAVATLRDAQPDVVLHTTSSFLEKVEDQLRHCMEAGVHVVSSTEELLYPFDRHPELAGKLSREAENRGVVLLGTGVNPGFAMDSLALMATGVCQEVRQVHVARVVNAAKRRLPLQQKVGAGLTTEAFDERKKTGTFGHIGLRESLLLVAHGLGWPLDDTEETLDYVVADEYVETPYLSVDAGRVAGIHHRIVGRVNGTEVLALDLKMYVGAKDARDEVRVFGDPPIHLVVRDGIFGDTATVAALVNAMPLVLDMKPGLRTMAELPLLRAFGTVPGGP